VAIARHGARVEIDPHARERMVAARDVVVGAASAGRPVYGVTTGLGPRVVDAVEGARGPEYSLRTLRGRATAVGAPLPTEVTRATMAVRLNGLCAGGAGTSEAIAPMLAAMLNAGVHPLLPGSGSVGASDLCLLAHLGLVMIAEGHAELDGEQLPAAHALARADLSPVAVEAKDGLALCSSSAVSCGAAALALVDARSVLAEAQVSAALAMEALRANLSPLDPRVVAARPAPGQDWAAAGLRSLLAGGELTEPGGPRRLQDPLSFRCASQIHGGFHFALASLEAALAPDLNGAADNPLVLADTGEILSTGNFHVPALAMALDAVAIAAAQVASALGERPARLKSEAVSGLPSNLVSGDSTRSGVAPLGKTAQALTLEIRHLAAPLAIHSMVGAGGIEDDSTGATQAALRVCDQLGRLRRLVAIELLVAAQALELRGAVRLGGGTQAAYLWVRESVTALEDDRPLGEEVERLAGGLSDGGLLRRVIAAAA
ncbi:MAG: aromatic amino acid lyase, partial [Actinomycetota bacterium]|nr:aromatic amino acid lyase [Actinomycetota bacterium]